MKTQAAVLVELGRPLEVVEITVPALKAGQVLVEMAYSGACHTQIGEARGKRGPDNWLPHLLGHEGSGVVLEAGREVSRFKAGDRVALSWIKGPGLDAGGVVYDWEGTKVHAGGVTTFQRHAVVSENRLTLLPDGLPMDQAIMLGCALPTGMGAVLNTAEAKTGESLVVFGLGGVGISALLGGRVAGCGPIIAIDVNEDKLDLAKGLGADYRFNPTAGDLAQAVAAICPKVDIAVEATGRPSVMEQVLAMVRPQGGRAVILGNAPYGETMTVNPRLLNDGRRLLGSWGGDAVPERDYPRYMGLMLDGSIDVVPLLSKPYGLEEINKALDDLEAGRITRPLISLKELPVPD